MRVLGVSPALAVLPLLVSLGAFGVAAGAGLAVRSAAQDR